MSSESTILSTREGGVDAAPARVLSGGCRGGQILPTLLKDVGGP